MGKRKVAYRVFVGKPDTEWGGDHGFDLSDLG
jgi:hypothetical protein